jgi:hypothetical protein
MPDRDAVDLAFAEAIETLARLADVRVERRDHHDDDDALTAWRKRHADRDRRRRAADIERHRQETELIERHSALNVAALVDERIAAALAGRVEFWKDVAGSVLAAERRRGREELAAAVGSLRADLAHGTNKAEIIDLPALPLRRTAR